MHQFTGKTPQFNAHHQPPKNTLYPLTGTRMVARERFELPSGAPEAPILDR